MDSDSPLAKQLLARMKAKDLTLSTLEQKAELKPHAIRNILRGKSQKPSAETLQAIADVLDCSVKSLLEDREIFTFEENNLSQEEVSSQPYQSSDLLLETVKVINKNLSQKKLKPSIRQVLSCVEEVYLYSLQKNLSHVDHDYADWFIQLIVE